MNGIYQFVFGGKFHRHVGGIFPTLSIASIPAKLVEFQVFVSILSIIFGGKIRKMLVDLLKVSKILVDFLSFSENSVEFFAPNTDWQTGLGSSRLIDFK